MPSGGVDPEAAGCRELGAAGPCSASRSIRAWLILKLFGSLHALMQRLKRERIQRTKESGILQAANLGSETIAWLFFPSPREAGAWLPQSSEKVPWSQRSIGWCRSLWRRMKERLGSDHHSIRQVSVCSGAGYSMLPPRRRPWVETPRTHGQSAVTWKQKGGICA